MKVKWLPRKGDKMALLGDTGKDLGHWRVDEVIKAHPDYMVVKISTARS
jgi:hypothetical protein